MYLFLNPGLPQKQSLHRSIIIIYSGGLRVMWHNVAGDLISFHQQVMTKNTQNVSAFAGVPCIRCMEDIKPARSDGQKNVPDCWKWVRHHIISCCLNCIVQDAIEQHTASDVGIFDR